MVLNQEGEIIVEAFDERDRHPLHHVTMQCIQKVSEMELAENSNESLQKKRKELTSSNETENLNHQSQYVCTGYDLVITREPCVM